MADAVQVVSFVPKSTQLDMWYGNKRKEVDDLNLRWSDDFCLYVGNVYIKGKAVGDYSAGDTDTIERWFPQFDWDKFWEN